MAKNFDLIEYSQMARELVKPRDLFDFWNDVCILYDKNQITKYEMNELKDIVFKKLEVLSDIKKSIN